MTGRCFVLAFALLPQIGAADVVPINLGEQGDYTRLVLTLSNAEGWQVTPLDRAFEIVVPDATSFETNAASDLVRSRIARVSSGATSNSLRIDLNCDCTTSSYVLGGQFLTIDVVGDLTSEADLPTFDTVFGLAQPWHNQLTQSFAGTRDEPLNPPPLLSNDPETTLNTLDTAVSTGIASATYQGFLQIRPEVLAQQQDRPNVSADVLNNIAVGVQSQLSTLDAQQTTLPDVAVFGCRDVSARLTESWQTQHSFSLERGAIHSRMIGSEEDSAPDQDAAVDLAVLLVGQGLGYEALALLDNVSADTDLTRALTYIATVIDSPKKPALMGLESCEETLAFWAYLDSAGADATVDALDPRSLMLTFKLLPEPLQNRMLQKFGDALGRAGHESYQAELQDFKNTYFAVSFADSGAPPPTVDFEEPASPQDILRAELTERDLDPSQATPNDPTQLTLELLEGLLVERRGTPAEPPLLQAVLERHVSGGNYIEVLSLLSESQARLEPDDYMQMVNTHLGKSIDMMTQSELLAFAFRSDLPTLSDDLRSDVAKRLIDMDVRVPPAFASAPVPPADTDDAAKQEAEVASNEPAFSLPLLIDLPDSAMPSFAQTEELLAGSTAIRNAIETLIDDTN